jgi:hypothetical protein
MPSPPKASIDYIHKKRLKTGLAPDALETDALPLVQDLVPVTAQRLVRNINMRAVVRHYLARTANVIEKHDSSALHSITLPINCLLWNLWNIVIHAQNPDPCNNKYGCLGVNIVMIVNYGWGHNKGLYVVRGYTIYSVDGLYKHNIVFLII